MFTTSHRTWRGWDLLVLVVGIACINRGTETAVGYQYCLDLLIGGPWPPECRDPRQPTVQYPQPPGLVLNTFWWWCCWFDISERASWEQETGSCMVQVFIKAHAPTDLIPIFPVPIVGGGSTCRKYPGNIVLRRAKNITEARVAGRVYSLQGILWG